MKIPVNWRDDGFWLSDAMWDAVGGPGDETMCDESYRFDKRLIKFIEEHPYGTEGNPDIELVYVPDEATDWMFTDGGGVVYVLNGKLYYAKSVEFTHLPDPAVGMMNDVKGNKQVHKFVHLTMDDLKDIE